MINRNFKNSFRTFYFKADIRNIYRNYNNRVFIKIYIIKTVIKLIILNLVFKEFNENPLWLIYFQLIFQVIRKLYTNILHFQKFLRLR